MQTQPTHIAEVPISRLLLHKDVQMRESLSQVAIQDYADAMEAGNQFPPVVAFGRTGGPYYVADGFHRVEAARRLKRKKIMVELHDGGRRDAMLFAMSANARHGVRRTNADKQRAVHACLADRDWVQWADSEIARRCAVTKSIVQRLREKMGDQGRRDVRVYVDNAGKLRTRKVPYRQPRGPATKEADAEVFGVCPYCHRPLVGD